MGKSDFAGWMQETFCIKLKEDFINVYVRESYGGLGLTEEEMILANNNELTMDKNN